MEEGRKEEKRNQVNYNPLNWLQKREERSRRSDIREDMALRLICHKHFFPFLNTAAHLIISLFLLTGLCKIRESSTVAAPFFLVRTRYKWNEQNVQERPCEIAFKVKWTFVTKSF